MPDFGPNAVKDMRAYVSHGMRHSGTMLFMGGRETNQAETLHEHQGEEGGKRKHERVKKPLGPAHRDEEDRIAKVEYIE